MNEARKCGAVRRKVSCNMEHNFLYVSWFWQAWFLDDMQTESFQLEVRFRRKVCESADGGAEMQGESAIKVAMFPRSYTCRLMLSAQSGSERQKEMYAIVDAAFCDFLLRIPAGSTTWVMSQEPRGYSTAVIR